MTELTEEVLRYQSDFSLVYPSEKRIRMEQFQRIVKKCMLLMYHNCSTNKKICNEDASEYLLYLMPSLGKMIRDFKYDGLDFEYYIFKMMRKRTVHFIAQKLAKQKRDRVCDLAYTQLQEVSEDPQFEYAVHLEEKQFSMQPLSRLAVVCQTYPCWKKRMATYILALLPYLEINQIAMLSEFMNMDEDELRSLAVELDELVMKKVVGKRWTLEKMSSDFFHHLETEFTLSRCHGIADESFTGPRLEKLRDRTSKQKRKLRFLESMKPMLTQGELSELMDIPRGTVASNLHYARILAACAIDPDSDLMICLPENIQILLSMNYEKSYLESYVMPFSLREVIKTIT